MWYYNTKNETANRSLLFHTWNPVIPFLLGSQKRKFGLLQGLRFSYHPIWYTSKTYWTKFNIHRAALNVHTYQFQKNRIRGSSSKMGTTNCAICISDLSSQAPCAPWTTRCGHTFHVSCMLEWLQTRKDTCPLCRAPYTIIQWHKSGIIFTSSVDGHITQLIHSTGTNTLQITTPGTATRFPLYTLTSVKHEISNDWLGFLSKVRVLLVWCVGVLTWATFSVLMAHWIASTWFYDRDVMYFTICLVGTIPCTPLVLRECMKRNPARVTFTWAKESITVPIDPCDIFDFHVFSTTLELYSCSCSRSNRNRRSQTPLRENLYEERTSGSNRTRRS